MPAKPIPSHKLIKVFPKEFRVKYKDVFELKIFYKAMRQWAKEYGWGDYESKGKGEGYERLYREIIFKDGSKEMRIRWRLFKIVPETPYLYYHLDIDYKLLGLKVKEVVKDGQKLKLDSGEIELKINAFIELNFLNDFEKSTFLTYFKDLFMKRIYARTLDQRKRELYQEVYELQGFMKEWFKLRRYLPYEESEGFFPSYVFPSHEKQ